MKRDLFSYLSSLTRDLAKLNTYCSLYEESLKKNIPPDIIDDIIIETKQLYLKYSDYQERFIGI